MFDPWRAYHPFGLFRPGSRADFLKTPGGLRERGCVPAIRLERAAPVIGLQREASFASSEAPSDGMPCTHMVGHERLRPDVASHSSSRQLR